MAKKDDSAEKIKAFLSTRSALICDESNTSRSSIKKILAKLGCPVSKIDGVQKLSEAMTIIESSAPAVVVADYNLGKDCGLTVFESLSQKYPDSQDRFFVLSTGSASESAVAEAADEDVDCFILKPFTAKSLEDSLIDALKKKVKPSKYRVAIEKGKKELNSENSDGAKTTFEEAKALDKKPALACYYVGKATETLDDENGIQAAIGAYQEGLAHNPIHYRSLTGLFDAQTKLDQKADSYQTVKSLASNFPISPKRLADVFELAVRTKNFADVDQFFHLYTKLENRPEDLTKRVIAGMIVCGSYLLRNGEEERGLEAITKAINSSGKKATVIREAARALARSDKADKAEETLMLMDPADRETDEVKALDFYIRTRQLDTAQWVDHGRKLIREGLKDYDLFRLTLQGLKELGNDDKVKELLAEAKAAMPEHADEFDTIAGGS